MSQDLKRNNESVTILWKDHGECIKRVGKSLWKLRVWLSRESACHTKNLSSNPQTSPKMDRVARIHNPYTLAVRWEAETGQSSEALRKTSLGYYSAVSKRHVSKQSGKWGLVSRLSSDPPWGGLAYKCPHSQAWTCTHTHTESTQN